MHKAIFVLIITPKITLDNRVYLHKKYRQMPVFFYCSLAKFQKKFCWNNFAGIRRHFLACFFSLEFIFDF